MRRNIQSYTKFARLVEILWADDYADLELEELPCSPIGAFLPERVNALLRVLLLHPELHIVSSIHPGIYINAFVQNGDLYYLAQGDSDPGLIHDPHHQWDGHLSVT